MELLSPAGHWEAMVAAVQNGANAIYMGVGEFNARRGAKNFSEEEYAAAVSYCHLRGVRVYLTLNTLLGDRELAAAGDLLCKASRWGVHGVIVQPMEKLEGWLAAHQVDIAVLTLPKENVPAVAERLVKCGVKGLWNYMGVELDYSRDDIVIENVHLGDSLMILNYEICRNMEKKQEAAQGQPTDEE